MAELPFVDTHFHLHDMKHPKLRYAWLEARRRARLSARHRSSEGAALPHQGFHCGNPLRQRAEGDSRPGGRQHARPRGRDRVAAGLRRRDRISRRASSPSAISRGPTRRRCSTGICTTPTCAAFAISARDAISSTRPGARGFAELAPRKLVVLHRHARGARARPPRSRVRLSRHRHLRGSLRDPDEARRQRVPRLALGDGDMAEAPNVVMKISGLGMCDPLLDRRVDPTLCAGRIEAFGVDRVVFGTNWPVDRMFSSYPDVDQRLCRDHRLLLPRGAEKMFPRNAERIFRI